HVGERAALIDAELEHLAGQPEGNDAVRAPVESEAYDAPLGVEIREIVGRERGADGGVDASPVVDFELHQHPARGPCLLRSQNRRVAYHPRLQVTVSLLRRLEGKVAIVTGAGRGIGRAVAVRLAEEGAAVVAAQRAKAEGDELAGSLAAGGHRATFVPTDVRDERDCERLANTALETYGRIDILCNNAGVGLLKSITETRRDEYDRVLDTNLWGIFTCSR